MKKGTVALVIIGTVWVLLLGSPSRGAAQFLGESVWTVSITQTEHGAKSQTFTMTGAITRAGTSYYTMQGYVNVPGDGPFILAGGGVLISDTLYLNLNTTQFHTDNWRDTGVMQVQVNKNTLNGSFYEVGRDFDVNSAGTNPFFDSRYTSGNITRTGPLINLVPGTGGSLSLLLTD
jgi:hypothetical protein